MINQDSTKQVIQLDEELIPISEPVINHLPEYQPQNMSLNNFDDLLTLPQMRAYDVNMIKKQMIGIAQKKQQRNIDDDQERSAFDVGGEFDHNQSRNSNAKQWVSYKNKLEKEMATSSKEISQQLFFVLLLHCIADQSQQKSVQNELIQTLKSMRQ